MRTAPTALEQSGTATDYRVNHSGTNTNCNSVPSFSASTTLYAGYTGFIVASGLTVGRAMAGIANSTNAYLAWSAER